MILLANMKLEMRNPRSKTLSKQGMDGSKKIKGVRFHPGDGSVDEGIHLNSVRCEMTIRPKKMKNGLPESRSE